MATTPATEEKAAVHEKDRAAAAMLVCDEGAIMAVTTGRVDDAVPGGVAPDTVAPSPGDDGATAAAAGGSGESAAGALDGGTVADVCTAGAGAGARWWRLAPVRGASAVDAAGAASTAVATRRAMKMQSLRPEAMRGRKDRRRRWIFADR
jgi:hypothetical protein